jgi:hypothetical protein
MVSRRQHVALIAAMGGDSPPILGLHVTMDDVTLAAEAEAPALGSLAVTLDAVTLAGSADALVEGSFGVTMDDVTLDATAELGDVLTVYPANFVRAPAATNMGHGGSTHRNWLAWVNDGGTLRHWYHTANDGSTSPGVDTGVDPLPYESEIAGSTGAAIALPAGYVSGEDRADLVAAALDADAAFVRANAALSGNPDGSWNIGYILAPGASFSLGTRTDTQRGAAGVFGSQAFRRAPAAEITGAADTAITRNLAQRFASYPPATARITAVSIVLGATVSTTAANIPRLGLRSGSASTTIPGNTVLFDFGQLPVSEVVAGRRATIRLTPAQSAALRTALDGATGELWMIVKAAATTQNTTLPSGGGWQGDMADGNLRVDNTTAGNVHFGSTAFPANWTDTAITFGAIMSVALHYEVQPATNGEAYPRDTLADITAAPNTVTLPNTVTAQTHALITGHRGAHLHQLRANLIDTGVRYVFKGSTDATDITADPDDPDLTDAVTLHDFGQIASTGTGVVMTAPTGDASVIVPEVAIVEFKGNGLDGRGWTTPTAITPIVADDAIYAGGSVGSADGSSQHELDYAGESGDPTTAFTSPTTGATTQPGNRPGLEMTFRRSADYITTP